MVDSNVIGEVRLQAFMNQPFPVCHVPLSVVKYLRNGGNLTSKNMGINTKTLPKKTLGQPKKKIVKTRIARAQFLRKRNQTINHNYNLAARASDPHFCPPQACR